MAAGIYGYIYFQNIRTGQNQENIPEEDPIVIGEEYTEDSEIRNNDYQSAVILGDEASPSIPAVRQQYSEPTPTWTNVPAGGWPGEVPSTPEPVQPANSYSPQNPWQGYEDKEAYCNYLATKITNEMKLKYPDEIDYDVPAEYRVTYDWDKARDASFQDCMSFQP
ncbi:MAG: hypothetical protein NUV98_03270 [Candidatus Roizmanbacteria bacterium]|nr:hypothetical protein [Candidatus Roizmanbacteria bacterium]